MIIDPYKPGTDLTASSLQWQVIQTNTNGLFFFLLFLVISGNKTDSAKLLIIVLESSGEIGLHRPLAHDIPCHAIYRQCLGTMYKSTMEGYSCAFPNPDRLIACRALLLYGSRLYYEMRLLWMRLRLGQTTRSLPKSRALICVQNGFLRRPSLTQHTGLD